MTVLTLIVTPHIRPDGTKHPNAFAAALDGELICVSETPLFDSAREMLRRDMAQPDDMLVMQHAGSTHWAMRGKVGEAAKWTIEESGSGPRRRRYRPRPAMGGDIEGIEGGF